MMLATENNEDGKRNFRIFSADQPGAPGVFLRQRPHRGHRSLLPVSRLAANYGIQNRKTDGQVFSNNNTQSSDLVGRGGTIKLPFSVFTVPESVVTPVRGLKVFIEYTESGRLISCHVDRRSEYMSGQ